MHSRNIIAGLATTVVLIASSISYSAAIFSGFLTSFLQIGIGFGLVGACVVALIFAFASGIPFAIAGPDSKPTAVLAVLAAAVAASGRAAGLDDSSVAALALSAVIAGTIVTGLVLYFLGRWKMGRWIRFIPYPVVGGFMAASGWLLMIGAVHLLTGVEPSWSALGSFASAERLQQLAAGILFAGAMAVTGRSKNVLGFPALLAGVAVAAHAIRAAQGLSVAQAQQSGWLLQVPPGGILPLVWLSHHWSSFPAAWLVRAGGDYVALIVVTAFTLLLGITSVEVEAKLDEDIDVDRELRVNGLANLVAGLAGGMAGTLSLSRTLFNYQNGARDRISGAIARSILIVE
jgi:SulP family sulfate permease